LNEDAASLTGVARAVAAARSLLAARCIRHPDDLHIGRLAQDLGASVAFRDTGGADGRIVRSKQKALICVNERDRGTPRGRWTAGHEVAHLHLHPDHDATDRIHGTGPKSGRDHQVEREADAFTAELFMSAEIFGPRCDAKEPTIATLDRLGEEFGTSLTSTGKRYTQFASAACALLECRDGVVLRAARSASFRGVAKARRALETGTAAYRLSCGERAASEAARVTGRVWGSDKLGVEMTEHAILIAESGAVLVWLWHAPVR
jgi:hypothetical protein